MITRTLSVVEAVDGVAPRISLKLLAMIISFLSIYLSFPDILWVIGMTVGDADGDDVLKVRY